MTIIVGRVLEELNYYYKTSVESQREPPIIELHSIVLPNKRRVSCILMADKGASFT